MIFLKSNIKIQILTKKVFMINLNYLENNNKNKKWIFLILIHFKMLRTYKLILKKTNNFNFNKASQSIFLLMNFKICNFQLQISTRNKLNKLKIHRLR